MKTVPGWQFCAQNTVKNVVSIMSGWKPFVCIISLTGSYLWSPYSLSDSHHVANEFFTLDKRYNVTHCTTRNHCTLFQHCIDAHWYYTIFLLITLRHHCVGEQYIWDTSHGLNIQNFDQNIIFVLTDDIWENI